MREGVIGPGARDREIRLAGTSNGVRMTSIGATNTSAGAMTVNLERDILRALGVE